MLIIGNEELNTIVVCRDFLKSSKPEILIINPIERRTTNKGILVS